MSRCSVVWSPVLLNQLLLQEAQELPMVKICFRLSDELESGCINVLGRKAKANIKRGAPLSWDLIETVSIKE
jgi:hypothetical protein